MIGVLLYGSLEQDGMFGMVLWVCNGVVWCGAVKYGGFVGVCKCNEVFTKKYCVGYGVVWYGGMFGLLWCGWFVGVCK